jgi:hypothetical protein
VSISTDSGATWTTTTSGQNGFANNNDVYGVFVDGSTVVAGTTGGGVSISTDGGANWSTTTSGQNGFANNNDVYDVSLNVKGTVFSWSIGDFDEDMDVDLTDYMALAGNFDPAGYANPIVASLVQPDHMATADQLSGATRGADESSELQRRIRVDRTDSHQAVFAQYESDRQSSGTSPGAELESFWQGPLTRREKERIARLFAAPDTR